MRAVIVLCVASASAAPLGALQLIEQTEQAFLFHEGEGDERWSTLELAKILAEVEELEFEPTDAARSAPRGSCFDLLGSATVARGAMGSFLESALHLGGAGVAREDGRLLLFGPTDPEARLRTVEPAALEGFAAQHPATLMRVTIDAPGLDARAIRAALRPALEGDATLDVRGPTRLEARGAAADVAAAIALLRALDGAGPGSRDELESFLAPAAGALTVPAGADGDLLTLLEKYARVAGHNLWISPAMRRMLCESPTGLVAGLRAEPAAVQSVVEAVLAEHELVLVPVRVAAPDLVAVRARGWREPSRFLLVADPDRAAARLFDHPALLVQAVLELRHLDVRQVASALRALASDADTQWLVAGNGRLVLRGVGAEVAASIRLLRILDRDAAGESERAAAQAPPVRALAASAAEPPSATEEHDGAARLRAHVLATGRALVLGQELASYVEHGGLRTPADAAAIATEAHLRARGLATVVLRGAEPVLCGLRIASSARRDGALVVEPGELDALADRPTLRVLVPLRLERVDPRASLAALRRRAGAAKVALALAGVAGQLVLAGCAADVAAFAAALRGFDATGQVPE